MVKVSIYYFVGLQSEQGFDYFLRGKGRKFYDNIFGDTKTKKISIQIGFFKTYWRKLPKDEEIDCVSVGSFEKIFFKYNDYSKNPYSGENDPGQPIIKSLGIKQAQGRDGIELAVLECE